MQNSRELIDHLLRNKPAERVGVLDHPWRDTLEKWVDERYPVNEEVVEETDERSIKRNGAGEAEERRLALGIRHLAFEGWRFAFVSTNAQCPVPNALRGEQ